MSEYDDYAKRESSRNQQYRKSFLSPAAQKWMASLSPAQREHAEKLGLLEPRMEGMSNGLSVEKLPAALEPRVEDVYDDGLVARPFRRSSRSSIPDVGWDDLLCSTDDGSSSRLHAFLCQGGNPRLRWACVCYLLGKGSCESFARKLGVSKQAFHYHVRKLEKQLGLPPLANQRSEVAREHYRESNKRRS